MSMKRKELKKKLSIYGADFNKWGKDDREQAAQLIENDITAQKLYAEALALDNAMNTLGEVSFDRDILERHIMAAIEREPEEASNVIRLSSPSSNLARGSVLAMAACIALLVSFGVIKIPDIPDMVSPSSSAKVVVKADTPPQTIQQENARTADNNIMVAQLDTILNEIEEQKDAIARENALLDDFFDIAETKPSSTPQQENKESPESTSDDSFDPEIEQLLNELYGTSPSTDYWDAFNQDT